MRLFAINSSMEVQASSVYDEYSVAYQIKSGILPLKSKHGNFLRNIKFKTAYTMNNCRDKS